MKSQCRKCGKVRGWRRGTSSPHRCRKCGAKSFLLVYMTVRQLRQFANSIKELGFAFQKLASSGDQMSDSLVMALDAACHAGARAGTRYAERMKDEHDHV